MLDSAARAALSRMAAEHNSAVTWPHRLSTSTVAAVFLRGADASGDDVSSLAVSSSAGMRRAAAFVSHARALADNTTVPPTLDRDLLPTGRFESARRVRRSLSSSNARFSGPTGTANKETSR